VQATVSGIVSGYVSPDDQRLTRIVRADLAIVYGLLAEVAFWPAIFPHVRSARVLRRQANQRLVAVRASWRGLPVGWRAVQTLDPEGGHITFRHVNALSRGSVVRWSFMPTADGVQVSVAQQVQVHVPLVGMWASKHILEGRIGPELAAEMLTRLQEIAEGGSLAGRI
jgi:ribosome-associated toxin RatA of RatAB toxin-antitoxin module